MPAMVEFIPETTRSWTTNLDGVPALTLRTSPTPDPHSLPVDHVLVKILSVSLNYKDAEIINGLFKHHKSSVAPPNLIPCADSVGVVVAVGPTSTPTTQASSTSSPPKPKWSINDRVISVSYPLYLTGPAAPALLAAGVGSATNGVLTTYRVFPSHGLVACPPSLTTQPHLACCLPIAGTTAWMGLHWWRPISSSPELFVAGDRSSESLLLQGTGGVSMFGLLFAFAANFAHVILTSGSDEKLARAEELVATAFPKSATKLSTINYRSTPQWHKRVLELTDNEGVDIIFENGGGGSPSTNSTLRSFQCVKFGGIINSIGYVGGKTDILSPSSDSDTAKGAIDGGNDEIAQAMSTNINVHALARNFTLKGLLNGPRDRMEEMLRFVEYHKIKPVVDKVFSFDDARDALQYLWDGKHFGKVVIEVSPDA
ncbi:Zinc-type alcohol dehydrogenase-like protein [Cyphellophora attinorum]|uniref:Zinc-type alcohol dehydrogenase-like protein n=1 Tax=Cyphellophora attinorum TaxID=1664694 RepID=A0A0N0NIF7_9EURO|nr:Zinc-type alcohol dehydrogenase-like protein [Phialophora attinorum]KPI35781.1 Zinc-type alcohol dehydrogenase-like protein [Phialophora attinorum]